MDEWAREREVLGARLPVMCRIINTLEYEPESGESEKLWRTICPEEEWNRSWEHAPEAHWGFQKIQPLPTDREEPISIPLVDKYFGWERFIPEGKKKQTNWAETIIAI